MASRRRVAVVGGGVVGLTCALVLSQTHDVQIFAERVGAATDSRKATAIWHVYLVPETERVLGWSKHTLEVLYELARTAPEAGVETVQGVELFRRGEAMLPSWHRIPRGFRLLTSDELADYNRLPEENYSESEIELLRANPVRWGYHIEAPAASMDRYLPWLEHKVRGRGLPMRLKRLGSLDEVSEEVDAIVNCAGFGARELLGDNTFVPYKGQYFVLAASENSPRVYVGDDDHPGGMAYAIPRLGEVMVGGCAEQGAEDLELTLDWADTLRRAGLFVPWLRERSLADQARPPVVCIRPARADGVRLELDSSCARVPVVHNYGHGGSGFSLSWGCAEAVSDILDGYFDA